MGGALYLFAQGSTDVPYTVQEDGCEVYMGSPVLATLLRMWPTRQELILL